MKSLFATLILITSLVADVAHDAEKAAFAVTIPIRIEQNLMFTDVVIEGETYNFLIDTGAPFVLSPELADKLNFRRKRLTSMGSSNSRRGTAEIGRIKSKVVLGGLKFSNFDVSVLDYNANTQVIKCLDFDGIIGANFMNGAIWHVDYDQKEILITSKLRNVPQLSESWGVKMEKRGFNKSPYIPVKVNRGNTGNALFDTGYAGFFDLPYKAYAAALRSDKLDERIRVLEGRGRQSEGAFGAVDTTGYVIEVPRLIIGREQFDRPQFELSHTGSTKIGARYLKGRLVTFDFPGKRLYVYEKEKRYSPESITSFHFNASFQREQLVVSMVYPYARSQGINIGDEIVSIDQWIVADTELCEGLFRFRNALRNEESVNIVFRRDGREFSKELIRRTYFD